MRLNAGKITLAVALIIAAVLAAGFVAVNFLGFSLAG